MTALLKKTTARSLACKIVRLELNRKSQRLLYHFIPGEKEERLAPMRKAARFTDAIHSSGVSPWLVLFLSPSAVLCMCFTMYVVVVCTCKKITPFV